MRLKWGSGFSYVVCLDYYSIITDITHMNFSFSQNHLNRRFTKVKELDTNMK